ncbi:MAG: nucleotidyltransferase substrate binding protein [Caldisericia bacterium]
MVNEFRLLTSKDIFHFAGQSNLITHPNYWNKFFEYRKISSKSFNQNNAAQIYKIALEFFPEVKTLISKVES